MRIRPMHMEFETETGTFYYLEHACKITADKMRNPAGGFPTPPAIAQQNATFTLTITNSVADWIPIVTPIDCNYYGIKVLSGNAIDISTNPNDPNQLDTTPGGGTGTQDLVNSACVAPPRWPATTAVIWARSHSGVQETIKVRFLY